VRHTPPERREDLGDAPIPRAGDVLLTRESHSSEARDRLVDDGADRVVGALRADAGGASRGP
jgi:hypothetical protein